jgi:hypothetical protein
MFHKLLCSKDFRNKLAIHIQENVPEFIECDVNHLDILLINEYNNPDGSGLTCCSWQGYKYKMCDKPQHHFAMLLTNKKSFSCHVLWTIYEETELFEIIEDAKSHEWGYKLYEGWKYPNLGQKTYNIIINFIREQKLKRILDGKI